MPSAYAAARAASHAQFSALQAAYKAQEQAHAAATAPCPHCGIEVSLSNHTRHVGTCLREPARFAAHKAALDDGTGGCIREMAYSDKYKRAQRGGELLSSVQLCRRMQTNSWGAVGVFFGLRPWTKSQAMVLANAKRFGVQVASEGEADLDAVTAPELVRVLQAGQQPEPPRWDREGLTVIEDTRRVETYTVARRVRAADGVYVEVRQVTTERWVVW